MKVLSLVAIFIGCVNANAQTTEQKKQPSQQQTVNPKLKERAMKAKAIRTHAHAAKAENKVGRTAVCRIARGYRKSTPYQGRTAEFLSMMVVDKLPADFPKYEKGTGIKYYNDVVENYCRKHWRYTKRRAEKKII